MIENAIPEDWNNKSLMHILFYGRNRSAKDHFQVWKYLMFSQCNYEL